MKIILILLLSCASCIPGYKGNNIADNQNVKRNHSIDTILQSAQKLIKSYPDFVAGYANNHIILMDDRKMLWDDGIKNKSPKQLLDKPDLKDMFNQKYTTGILNSPPVAGFDPGRTRNEPFFMKMYGSSEKEVRKI